jgi:hypothetical protein
MTGGRKVYAVTWWEESFARGSGIQADQERRMPDDVELFFFTASELQAERQRIWDAAREMVGSDVWGLWDWVVKYRTLSDYLASQDLSTERTDGADVSINGGKVGVKGQAVRGD